ncbi:protein YAE1 homolog [Rhineura floridana]|uniref:protein YAE1 homolog n=1 Tax=Rhineura floridana TaxID=261503 RepID=UPI002AC83A6B|nr:protein YAE1 homolog [Rhineura floridana]
MSWVQSAISQQSEDVFDEDADDMDIAQKEWKSAMEKRVKEGYREGIEAGKLLTLQQGFTQGYKEAARRMNSCGQLKGTISALSSWCHHNGCSSVMLNEMTDLLNELRKYEEYMFRDLNSTHLQPQVEDLLDTIEGMDLDYALSPAKQYSGTEFCENGTEFSEQYCRNDSGTDSFQDEHCRRRKEGTDYKGPTFTCLKEKIVNLVEQLGLSPDTIDHIQLLQS